MEVVKIATRTMLIFGLLFYLIGLGIFLSIIDIVPKNSYDVSSKSIDNGYSFNLITNISYLPIEINILFIYLPLAILIFLIAIAFIPTVNAGS